MVSGFTSRVLGVWSTFWPLFLFKMFLAVYSCWFFLGLGVRVWALRFRGCGFGKGLGFRFQVFRVRFISKVHG